MLDDDHVKKSFELGLEHIEHKNNYIEFKESFKI